MVWWKDGKGREVAGRAWVWAEGEGGLVVGAILSEVDWWWNVFKFR